MSTIDQKKIFMLAAGQPVRETPGVPTVEERKLNVALIFEELYELAQAYGIEGSFQKMLYDQLQETYCVSIAYSDEEGATLRFTDDEDTGKYDPVAALDAMVDLRVVNDGPILSSGFQGIWQEAVDEVHKSNSSKICQTNAQVANTIQHYRDKGIDAKWYDSPTGGYIIKRVSDGKVLKPTHYYPANLSQFLDGAE